MACTNDSANSYREFFGLNRKGPDEFQVVARPPLTVPPDFNLVAPKNGAEFAAPVSMQDQAHQKLLNGDTSQISDSSQNNPKTALFTTPATSAGLSANSSGDTQFLNDAGANKADKNIRDAVTSDVNNGVVPKSQETYLFGNKQGDPEVDPAKEAQRIKQDQSQNIPPSSGTPATIPQSGTLWGNIFR